MEPRGKPLVELAPAPARRPARRARPGLFHLAILVPSRLELARALRRVSEPGWRFTGASDHLVSEALYLRDPEGNGIEIYRDRPREEWRHAGGEIEMDTLPLDLEGVLGELADDDSRRRRHGARDPPRATCTCTSPTCAPRRRSTRARWAST